MFHRQLEMRLSKSEGGFFAGGSEPTAADFMMIFPLELWGRMFPESFGPMCREYIDRIHERYACFTPTLWTRESDDETRPAFKRVRADVDISNVLRAH